MSGIIFAAFLTSIAMAKQGYVLFVIFGASAATYFYTKPKIGAKAAEKRAWIVFWALLAIWTIYIWIFVLPRASS